MFGDWATEAPVASVMHIVVLCRGSSSGLSNMEAGGGGVGVEVLAPASFRFASFFLSSFGGFRKAMDRV